MLVLDISGNGVQIVIYNIAIFNHEELDVYGLELQSVVWTTDFLEQVSQSPVSYRRELLDQVDRACISFLLNVAKGTEDARPSKNQVLR